MSSRSGPDPDRLRDTHPTLARGRRGFAVRNEEDRGLAARCSPRKLALRLVLIWAGLALAGFVFAGQLATLLLPMMEILVNNLQSDFSGRLSLDGESGQALVRMDCMSLRPLLLSATGSVPAGAFFDGGATHVAHVLVPLLILLTVLMAYPVTGVREGLTRALWGAAALIPVIALTTPLLLAGRVYMMLTEVASAGDPNVREPFIVTLTIFMESGGRWLLPLAAGILCVLAATPRSKPAKSK